MTPRILTYFFLLACTFGNTPRINAQQIELQTVGPVQVALISEQTAIQSGVPFEVGLYLVPDNHWHLYWKNPGDAGLPPSLIWNLPKNFSASDIQFPPPSLIRTDPLAAYGYSEAVLYPVRVTPPENLYEGDSVVLSVKADWLVCKEVCLPGEAQLTLTLPVKNNTAQLNKVTAKLFQQNRDSRAVPLPDSWQIEAALSKEKIYLDFQTEDKLSDSINVHFYAAQKATISHAALQPLTEVDSGYRLEIIRSPYSLSEPENLVGLLEVSGNENRSYYEIDIPFGTSKTIPAFSASESSISVWLALLFAFLGGLILNLMPCVLPVLSIKVLGLVEQANQGRRSAITHGLIFTLGVLTAFWVIVSVMLFLQAGGEQIGWGFQLQSPVFVLILASFMFLFALNLFGLFEINFLVGVSQTIKGDKKSGLGAAFISGITATLVATPCTAPFMGAALGFTLTQSAFIALLTYTFVGIGMAFPYLLLAAFPVLLKFVPKPGRWMETFKQAMGFLLAATVIWLGWILSNLAGATALIVMLLVLLFIAIAGWIFGRWGMVSAGTSTRWFSRLFAFIIIILSLFIGQKTIASFGVSTANISDSDPNGLQWENYNSANIENYLNNKQHVFIDFTAAWCLSCKVNEQVAFSSEEVQSQFKKLDIKPIKADWTHRSNEITQALASFGRNSVPLYVLYKNGDKDNPIILPEIITPGIVLEQLQSFE